MSNPAPTLNQINAFNATQGTTIDFNIIGGTEVIRSNKIYIYDLSDNSLICTHLYVSTESIHELPPNTNSSIVYASGKSSADFTNNTQYYAQIQTFTDTSGTQGASGLSIAKLFWCLPTPTLTLSTIPTTISTTSYNVSATYTPNTSGSATNEIQEFQFNLYSAIGALLQTSGVVLYGEGVDLSYNFSGLEVDSTYYVTLDVTTTQGMNVSAQSNTFTVSIDTPTIGSASVVNNSCDGYISVTSSLSSEYEHEQSVDAGEVMSFTTDSPNDIKELQVDFHPIQDGTPWMSSTPDTTPYLFRASPQLGHNYNSKLPTIVGGSVVGNQLVQNGNFADTSVWGVESNATLSIANNVATIANTSTNRGAYQSIDVVNGHKYLCMYEAYADSAVALGVVVGGSAQYKASKTVTTTKTGYATIAPFKGTTGSKNLYIYPQTTNVNCYVSNVQLIDLTAKCTAPIADRAYAKEQAQAGSGIAWLKSYGFISDSYEAYDTGTIKSVEAAEHVTRGFNQWDEEWEVGGISTTTGLNENDTSKIRSKNYCKCVGGATYYVKSPYNTTVLYFYDANNSFIGVSGTIADNTYTFPINAEFFKIRVGSYSTPVTSYSNDICINISDSSRNGEYEAYTEHSYPLGNVTLRGVPKVDANDNIYYDGDTYTADGTVGRRYAIVDLGTLTWNTQTTGTNTRLFYGNRSDGKPASGNTVANAISPYAQTTNINSLWSNDAKGVGISENGVVAVRGDVLSPSDFKTAMDGVYFVYEKATPTTETTDPFTTPMLCDPNGTEEWVTDNGVPVGQSTTYADIYPISGWTGCEVLQAGVNLLDVSTIQSGVECGLSGGRNAFVLSKAGTYTIKANTPSQGYLYARVKNADGTFGSLLPIIQNTTYATQTVTIASGQTLIVLDSVSDTLANSKAKFTNWKVQIETGSTASDYQPYQGTTYSVSWQTEAGTVYGGTVDVVSGVLTVDRASVDMGDMAWSYSSGNGLYAFLNDIITGKTTAPLICSAYKTSVRLGWGNTQNYEINCNITIGKNTTQVILKDSNYTSASDFKTAMTGQTIVYELATPQTYQLTPHQIQTLVGQNNLWHDTNGEMTIMYQLPITDLLVKRKDVSQVGSQWLTLHSVPITQADDMDFTFIDFLNQYGKTYQYALVPVLAQDQSGVIVQIEGGYTVSDNVDSIFDGVYIADQTNVERVKAGVGYGNVDMNQNVGTIVPIGSKYPIVVTNSQNQYHNGSIRGTIVPNDFYSNGNLSRIDMVNKRDELEQFLTNKRAKIIKDWNGKIWLVMIMSNVSCSFDDNYGMGMVSFSADWLEVGDPTNQQDLYNAGLINVGGV